MKRGSEEGSGGLQGGISPVDRENTSGYPGRIVGRKILKHLGDLGSHPKPPEGMGGGHGGAHHRVTDGVRRHRRVDQSWTDAVTTDLFLGDLGNLDAQLIRSP